MKAVTAVALCGLVLAWTVPASAQNQILNPDFDVNDLNWTASGGGTYTRDGDSGTGAPLGAANLSFTDGGGNDFSISSNCILISAGVTRDFGGQGRLHVDPGSGSVNLLLRFYSSSNCTTGITDTVLATPGATVNGTVDGVGGQSFTRHAGTTMSPASTQSMRLFATVQSGVAGTYRGIWDRLYVGPPGTTPVELESFSIH